MFGTYVSAGPKSLLNKNKSPILGTNFRFFDGPLFCLAGGLGRLGRGWGGPKSPKFSVEKSGF